MMIKDLIGINPKSYAIKTIQMTSNSKIKLNLADGGETYIRSL